MGNSESQTVIIDDNSSEKKKSSRKRHSRKMTSSVVQREESKSDHQVNQVLTETTIQNCWNPEDEIKLTDKECQLLVRSWAIVEAQISQVGISSYLELFRRAPESLELFPFLKQLSPEDLEFYSQLKNHSIRVTGVISMLIKQLEQDKDKAHASLRDLLLDLGRRHFSYGAKASHMELLGRVFVESLLPLFEKDPEYEDIKKAWVNFFRLIVFWLQTGYNYVQNKGRIPLI